MIGRDRIQELADMKGAGRAQSSLKKAGFWNEHEGQSTREWSVVVEGCVKEREVVTVTAANRDTAKSKALEEVELEFEDAEVLDIEELPEPNRQVRTLL